ncbi:hypothetical protein Rmet_5464 (plasmid) [Cupriavidus metallidurans CH34]|uniref:Uncharacterized protein n=1 Tax=Cupriavidus metallidurans (strain ATCC 43123 / DSM 2839 / NBRC 102507 / CH34) TaxID=266264 RepID=Q1LC03_CUPMC|nr:hypothetical protein Rmet_5464 [Cupriavidus metallidurans CH34]
MSLAAFSFVDGPMTEGYLRPFFDSGHSPNRHTCSLLGTPIGSRSSSTTKRSDERSAAASANDERGKQELLAPAELNVDEPREVTARELSFSLWWAIQEAPSGA